MSEKILKYKNTPIISLAIFVVLFIGSMFLISIFTKTEFYVACLLVVIECLLAVCFDRLNLACLIGIGIAELVVGILTKNLVLTIICLVIYILTFILIHLLNECEHKLQFILNKDQK